MAELLGPVAENWRLASDQLGRDRGEWPDARCWPGPRREPDLLYAPGRPWMEEGLNAPLYDRETGMFICTEREQRRILELLQRAERREAQRREAEEREALYRKNVAQRHTGARRP